MSFVAKIFVDYSEVGPACGPYDLYSITDNTGIYGENCSANVEATSPFLTDVPKGDGITGLTASTGFTFTAPSPLTKKIKIVFKGNCSGNLPVYVCIVGIPTPTPTPTPTATPTATPTVTPTPTPACVMNGGSATFVAEPTPTPTATGTPTPTPTATNVPSGRCWTLTYNNQLPTDLYVRYRKNETSEVVTVLISSLEVMDNGDGTYDAAICVSPGGSYNEPVFVQGGIEQAGGTYLWSMGGDCTSSAVCLISSPDPTPTLTPTPTATPTPYYLQLQPCTQAPGTGVVWTINAYTQLQIQVGDIFWSAGGAYYQVINYQQAQPNPVGTIDGSKAPSEIQSCADTPNPYVPPTVNPGVSLLIHTGQTFGNSSGPCNMYESDIATNSTNVYLSGHTIPANGDYAYTTAACNQTYVGNSNYYASLVNSIRYTFTIGDGGYINNVTNCANVPTFTPTPTPTVTPTPTATPTPYYLQLQPCSEAPGTGIVWTINAFTQLQIQVGDIFHSAGGAYYQVINYQQAQPNPVGTIDGSKSTEYTSCDDTLGHYVAPPVNPGVSLLIHTGQTFSDTNTICGMQQSDIATNSGTVFLNGHGTPVNGDYAYTTAACSQTYVGNSNYYASLVGGTKYAFTIGDGGYINNVTNCSSAPTFTPTPTVTPTPTPTATSPAGGDFPAGAYITITNDNTWQQDSFTNCSGNYNYTGRVTVNLFNSDGSPLNAPTNLIVTFVVSNSSCIYVNNYNDYITITAGTSTGSAGYNASGYEMCPFDSNCSPYTNYWTYDSNDKGLTMVP